MDYALPMILLLIGLGLGFALRPRRAPDLAARLARIDAAQTRIEALSSDVLSLQDILSNKQARGAFGEMQLEALVRDALPSDAVSFQATLSNGRRPDCLIHLPDAPLVIDAKFPLEAYEAHLRAPSAATARAFGTSVRTHIRAIAERYLIPGETAETALMFLPSEAVFAELHAHHGAVVREGFALGVYVVSPSTCMATLTTLRAVLKDHRLRQSARELRAQLGLLGQDVELIARRAAALQRHMAQSQADLQGLGIATARLTERAGRIEALDFAPADQAGEAPQTKPRIIHRA